jgi:hypothetical protein
VDIKLFLEFCNFNKLLYVNALRNNDLINYCHEQAHYLQYKITKNVLSSKSIEDKLNGVKGWSDEQIQHIFDNIKLLTHTKGYIAKQYPMILKLAMCQVSPHCTFFSKIIS